MTDGKAAEIVRIVRRLRPGTVVTYGDISLEIYGHTGAGQAVGQVIRAETRNAERDGTPESFQWWRVVRKGLRPHEGAGEWLMKEGVTFRRGVTVHPRHHAPEQVGENERRERCHYP
ncbi:MAG: MGMT family protein [Thiotrichales bacterium]|nr:MGMT family protein [Thiotrichales bacterium]